ncbi:MAG: histidine kinase [Cyclobacteriaceae bacterium]
MDFYKSFLSKTLWIQIFFVVAIWTLISFIIIFKTYVLSPIADLGLSPRQDFIAWGFSLIFIPLIVFVVHQIVSRKYNGLLAGLTLIICFGLASVLWDQYFSTETTVLIGHPQLATGSDFKWTTNEGMFLNSEEFDMFSSFLIIAGISFVTCIYQMLRTRETDSLKLREMLTKSKLDLLKSQIHPHFIFNALNTVSGLMEKNTERAQDVMEDLSYLLRSSLKKSDLQEVELAEEVTFLKKYLAIEQIRFGNKLDIHWQIAEDAASALIPHMILQPIIENSLKHGFEENNENNKLSLTINVSADTLRIRVEDNGEGIQNGFVTGLGLDMVEKRINSLYGDPGQMQIRNLDDQGTEVIITIPFKTASA